MQTRQLVLKMQRIILRQLKDHVRTLQGPLSPQFSKYTQAYEREFNRYLKISTKSELLKSVKKANIVLGADFHAFLQSQKTHLRILREAVRGRRDIILGLEAFESKDQIHIDDFLADKINEDTFLLHTHYIKNWGFPWSHYKLFFDFAKTHGIRLMGLNIKTKRKTADDLTQREIHSSKIIAELYNQNPKALLYILYGDLHLSRPHLPKTIEQAIGKKKSLHMLTVFQNSEKLYWKLSKRKLEDKVDVVKLRADAYCVVNSPPWVKWQAYMSFLERKFASDESADYVDTIHQLCKMLMEIFDVDVQCVDFHMFEKGDFKFLNRINKLTTTQEKKTIEKLVHQGRSFFIPRLNVFYLTRYELNHIAFLVGQYIHSKLRREKIIVSNLPQEFTAQVWKEAVGFFVSKILNSRRKFESLHQKANYRVTLIVLEYKLREQIALKSGTKIKMLRKHKNRRYSDYLTAASVVGAGLGQKIYEGFIEESIDMPRLRSWLKHPLLPISNMEAFYLNVLREVSRLNLKQVGPDERL